MILNGFWRTFRCDQNDLQQNVGRVVNVVILIKREKNKASRDCYIRWSCSCYMVCLHAIREVCVKAFVQHSRLIAYSSYNDSHTFPECKSQKPSIVRLLMVLMLSALQIGRLFKGSCWENGTPKWKAYIPYSVKGPWNKSLNFCSLLRLAIGWVRSACLIAVVCSFVGGLAPNPMVGLWCGKATKVS